MHRSRRVHLVQRFATGIVSASLLSACAPSAGNGPASLSSAASTRSVLEQFTAPGVPAVGPSEKPVERSWPQPANVPTRPGHGLAEHPMLFAGEGHNEIYLVNDGRVVWTYASGPGGEIDDVWMLSNGHVLYTRQSYVEEITPRKEVVWHYDAPAGTEIHSAQPLGLDRVLFVQNGLPPKAIIIDKRSGAVVLSHDLPAPSLTDPKTVHGQFRRIRITAAGTYLLPYLTMGKVVEFDKDFREIWSYSVPYPWAAVRLKNGNTLVVAEHEQLVREVDAKGATVWQLSQADLPAEVVLHNIQTVDRLANGNTVLFSYTGGLQRAEWPNIIQAVEVTPDKRVVWVLQDWKNLGPATTAQFLDQSGVPERPGDLAH
jgi:hypothetical protein